jgi:hypothetical protein
MTLFDGIEAGTLVRVRGMRGLYRAVAPCSRNKQAWWFASCTRQGIPDGRDGARAFCLSRITPTRKARR